MNKLNDLTQTLLMGPGPSSVSPNVYKALSTYTIGHLDPQFIQIMDEIKKQGYGNNSLNSSPSSLIWWRLQLEFDSELEETFLGLNSEAQGLNI